MTGIEYALTKARQLPYKQGEKRHFAIVVDRRGRVVASASNSYQKTHTLMAKTSKKLGVHKEYCHSEMLAIVRSKGRGEKLIVVRVDSRGDSCYSAPCLVQYREK